MQGDNETVFSLRATTHFKVDVTPPELHSVIELETITRIGKKNEAKEAERTESL